MTLKDGLVTALLAFTLLRSGGGQAAAPQIVLQVGSSLPAGYVADGTVLARGIITGEDPHAGFRIWSGAAQNGAPHRYILSGKGGAGHRLNVRLSGTDWQPDALGSRGAVQLTDRLSAGFRVEVDGNQTVPADIWPLQVQGEALTAVGKP